jgi:DNA primase
MSVSDDIKASINLLDEVSLSVELKRAGKNYSGFCPFHDNHRTPAFVVFPDSQTWRCFGTCNTGGDLFTFVMKRDNIDFKEALQLLARKAGIELRPMSQHEQRVVEQRRAREEVFGAAMDFFRQRLGSTRLPAKELSPGLEYALYMRGWDLETINASGIGFFGKDWDELRKHFVERGIDPECPAAVALVGYRGDVVAWGSKYGVKPASAWIEAKKIPAMRPDMLIYPHTLRGRVVYMAGRTIFEKSHWNLPDELVGLGKEVFFNHMWFGESPSRFVVVVEGQADAITLGKMGIRAVALCGVNHSSGNERSNGSHRSSSDNTLLSELKRAVKEGATVALGLDGDDAGKKTTNDLIAALQDEIGIKSTQVVVVEWGAKDPNDWLLAMQVGEVKVDLASPDETYAEEMRNVIGKSKTHLQRLVEEAKKNGEEEALRNAFGALVNLDPFEIEHYKDWIATDLGLAPRRFDNLLRAARREAGRTDDGQPRYFIEAGRICVRSTDSQGGETIDTLTNFAAEIKADVLRDNGQDVLREFHIHGRIGKRNLPTAAVKAEDFSQMNWVLGSWGSMAIIEAGSRRRDQVRAAIQHLSRDVERKVIYTHTGWREIDGQRVFLSAAGAVGADDSLEIEVELDRDLELYAIPPVADDIGDAMRASLTFLGIAPPKVAFPLWAAVYMAPLREWINLGFNIWVFGGSGAMKSTLVALAMNHYGEKFDDKHLPASFMDTGNRIEQKSFTAKDLLLVVDDYAPQKDGASAAEYKRTAQRIIRGGGNMTGRGRMSSDATARATYVPRSVLVITGTCRQASHSRRGCSWWKCGAGT